MKRTQIYLTETGKINLEKESKKIGISMAELLRRIIDERYKEKEK